MAACLNGIKGEAIARAGLRSYDSVPDESLAGVDTADSAFWQGALELFSSKAEQLEELTQES